MLHASPISPCYTGMTIENKWQQVLTDIRGMFRAQCATRVCNLLVAKRHTCYCALVRGAHVKNNTWYTQIPILL